MDASVETDAEVDEDVPPHLQLLLYSTAPAEPVLYSLIKFYTIILCKFFLLLIFGP